MRLEIKTSKVRFLIFALSCFITVDIFAQPYSHRIDSGQHFLRQQIARNALHVNVQCIAPDASYCPTTYKGEVFGSYFVTLALKESLSPSDKKTLLNLLFALKRKISCWASSYDSPIDADDTAFALQTLKMLGLDINKESTNCLKNFYYPKQNLYSTFVLDPELKPKMQSFSSGENNLGFQPEVNANVALVLFISKQLEKINYEFITNAQTSEGYWPSYFYPSYYYSTFVFLKVLCSSQQLPNSIKKGVNFILTNQNKDGGWGRPSNSYETALALSALKNCSYKNSSVINKAEQYLLKNQMPDGSWATKEVIWHYTFMDDPLVTWVAFDNNKVITTSLAINALKGER